MGRMYTADGQKPFWMGLKNKRKAKLRKLRQAEQRRKEAKEREKQSRENNLDEWAAQFEDWK